MGLLDFFRRKKKPKIKMSATITGNTEVNPTYLKELDNGLLPGDFVLMDWLDGRSVNDSPPGYFKYSYGIDVPESTHKLKEKDLLIDASPQESLQSLKVPELKQILKDTDLKLSGNKVDLIKRIIDNLSDEQILKYIKELPLILSTKGKFTLEKYYYIVPAHKNDSKDGVYCVATAIDFIKNNKLNFIPGSRDISWALFQRAYLKNHQKKMYGLARNNMHAMAKQLQRENNMKLSLKHYLDVCVMDLSGLSNGAKLDGPNLTRLAPGIISIIKDMIDNEGIDESQLKDIFSESWSNTRQSIPFHYLSEDECYDCITMTLEGNEDYTHQVIVNAFEKINKKTFEQEYGLMLPISFD